MNDINAILPDYYIHRIAVVGKSKHFLDYRDTLVDCIQQFGFEANAYLEISEALADRPTCIVVINPIMHPVPQDSSVIWIMIQTEQLFNDNSWPHQIYFKNKLNILKQCIDKYDIVLEWNKINIQGLKTITKSKVEWFPYYWYPDLEKRTFQNVEDKDKDYDLIFIGTMPGIDNRRKKLLDYLSQRYKVYPKTEAWYEEKEIAIANSKICLNIHFDESRYVEFHRLFDFFAKKCFVLSEPIYFTEPFVEGEDYVEFFWTNLCEKIDYYLLHEDERNRIVENAYQKLRKNTLMDSAKILIDNLLLISYDKMREEQEKKEEENLKEINRFFPRLKRFLKSIINGRHK